MVVLVYIQSFTFRLVMGDFKNGIGMKVFTSFVAVGIIAINIFFVAQETGENLPNLWYPYLGIAVAAVIYFCFIFYLAIYLLICLGWENLARNPWIQKFYRVDGFLVPIEDHNMKNGKAVLYT